MNKFISRCIYPHGSLLQNISAPHHRGSQHGLIIMYTRMIWQKASKMGGVEALMQLKKLCYIWIADTFLNEQHKDT
jgi:hypothetical protein